jgi:hypothetical protein
VVITNAWGALAIGQWFAYHLLVIGFLVIPLPLSFHCNPKNA